MPDDASVNDVINPITALAFAGEHSGGPRLLLAGEGPYLKAFDYQRGRLLATKRIFETQAVHGISTLHLSNDQEHNNVVDLLIWGGRCARRGLLRHSRAAEPSPVEIELKWEFKLDDWILDGCFDPKNDSTMAERLQQNHTAILVTAHNMVHATSIDEEAGPFLKRVTAGPRSILYSAHIWWSSNGKVLVASGTVFGEVLIWSFLGHALLADATSPAPALLHFKLTGHEGSVFGIRISPDLSHLGYKDISRLLASCSDDRTIRLWDISCLEAGRTITSQDIENFETSVWSLDNGEKGVSANRCVTQIMGHSSRIWDVCFLTSGNTAGVLSFGEDGTAQIWQLSTNGNGPDFSQSHTSGNLTLSHQQTYAYHSGKNLWASALIHRQYGQYTLCTGGADGRIVSYDILEELGPNEQAILNSKWTMQDVVVQLEENETLLSSNAKESAAGIHKTICEQIFDALAGTWMIEREIRSALPMFPSGTFSGEAQFESRPQTAVELDKELLYIEDGKFTTEQGLAFTATRRYVYRYQREVDKMSVWFVKPDENTAVDYLFHELRLQGSTDASNQNSPSVNETISSRSYHLCVEDHYTPNYVFHLGNRILQRWQLAYRVKGPQKDYIADASYVRKAKTVHPIMSGEEETSGTPKAKRPSLRISPSRLMEKDGFKSYVFLRDGSFLVTTAQGIVLIGSLPSPMGRDGKAKQDVFKSPDVKWEIIGQYETLKSSSIATRAKSSDAVLLSGSAGTVHLFDPHKSEVSPLFDLGRKIAFLHVQNIKPAIGHHLILAVCLGHSVANIRQLNHDGRRSSDMGRQAGRLNLPADFIVTSACYSEILRVWMIGSRNGAMAFYDELSFGNDRALEPFSVITDVHGNDSITVMMCLPQYHQDQALYVLTAGRDGHYAVHKIITSNAPMSVIDTLHRSTTPFGPNIEGAALDDKTQDLLLWGFRSKEFVVWNATKDMETMSIDCGGAHRNWEYTPRTDGSDGGTFIWTKASVFYVHSQPSASHRMFRSGGHGREIKAMAVSPVVEQPNGSKLQYIATGSEDTALRIWSYSSRTLDSGHSFQCLGTFRKHTTGIQQLRWSADGKLLFSTAGYEEFFAWRVQPVPFLGIGAACEAVCPKVTEDGDLRITDFALAEYNHHPRGYSSPPTKQQLISLVYSDSSIRVYCYPSTASIRSFELLQSGTYTTHCLTASSYLHPHPHKILCTASSNGHIVFWPINDPLQQPPNTPVQELHYHHGVPVHQNSIKSLFTLPLHPENHDSLIITGGDDGAIGITRRLLPKDHLSPITKTLLIPKAHAAAVNAVAYLRDASPSEGLSRGIQQHIFVSSGNDQRLKTWVVRAREGFADEENLIEGIEVRLLGNRFTCVADVACLGTVVMGDGVGVVVAGIGMEGFGDVG
ncbi:MAG: hypothetical protein Q9182_006153 [Xanthomendoza sp. 2 TL-2023]